MDTPVPVTRRPTTMRDIAAAAGVTLTSVSLALTGRPGVSEQRRLHIQKLAAGMGYYPHAAARMLSSKKTGQIGIVIARKPGHSIRSASPLLEVFIDRCEQRGQHYHVEFHHHDEDDPDESFHPTHALAGGLVDGVILAGDVGQPLRDWLDQRGLPFVSIHEPARYSVIPDEICGMRAGVQHLVDLGHRRIAAYFGPQRYEVHRLRRSAFFAVVAEMGLELPDETFTMTVDPDHPADAWEWTRNLLARPDRPTAAIGSRAAFTQAAIMCGMRIPRDFSLIEWIDPRDSGLSNPPVAAIYADLPTLMRHAMELLDELLAGQVPQQPLRRVEARLFINESTGPAP